MKIYRCVIGCLLVFFIVLGVWYVVSSYNEQSSKEEGTLIWMQDIGNLVSAQDMRGVIEDVPDHSLC